ncbi:phosphotyrosine protein phosphatase [Fomitiporia mediterranea MF3/22]|uniref:phosphotyrosine protein phosphatase n=1 Tax=Fomitiporia mediterranea (strain MF3/22) TaxID=694068 RepID=UPI0004408466|nr:phosphotyrosine protein phosphatase [Fomitiporia mediterranea MF3/22]EJD04090.1 phosphotyrosine protein phosphatase [Fomitiporia mediterranea MF3/22]
MATSVLIVCLGNICRSPMGEAVLRHTAQERGIEMVVDSAGTAAYHVGEDPDDRTVEVCRRHKVPIEHSARQVVQKDFSEFDYILAADESNLYNLQRKAPKGCKAQVRLWGSYLDDKPIADPYYGGLHGFEQVFRQCRDLSNAFLDAITEKKSESS